MRNILGALLRTLVLLVCSVIQVFAAIFEGISVLFGTMCDILCIASDWLMERLEGNERKPKQKAIAE